MSGSVRGGGCDSPRLLGGQVPGLLDRPLAGRAGGDGAEVDLAAGDLDEEEDSVTFSGLSGGPILGG